MRMRRLNEETKINILNFLKNGYSLNKIKSILKIPKTTIYYHRRKNLGRKYTLVKIDRTNIERIGETIGFFAGDGNYYHNKKKWSRGIRFYFNKKEKLLIDYYKNSFKLLANKLPNSYTTENLNVLEFKSKEFSNFLLEYLSWENRKGKTIRLKNKRLLNNKFFMIGFLRGLIDSDGYVRKSRKEIYYGSISYNLFCNFIHGLDLFRFKYKTYIQKRKKHSDFYKVRLTSKEVDRFVKLIKPIKRF